MKTHTKCLLLTLGFVMSTASFALLNEAGSSVATHAAHIGKFSIDTTRHVYVLGAKPATETVGKILQTGHDSLMH